MEFDWRQILNFSIMRALSICRYLEEVKRDGIYPEPYIYNGYKGYNDVILCLITMFGIGSLADFDSAK